MIRYKMRKLGVKNRGKVKIKYKNEPRELTRLIAEIMPIIFVNIFVVNAIRTCWETKIQKSKIYSSSNINIDVSNVAMKRIKKKKKQKTQFENL